MEFVYFALILFGMAVGVFGARLLREAPGDGRGGRRRARSFYRGKARGGRRGRFAAPVRPVPQFDPAIQLQCVMGAEFRPRKLLNRYEARVLYAAEKAVAARRRGERVMAQVSLGEILASPDEAAFRAINSKRVDFLVIDRSGSPLSAIEYQGGGHHQGGAAARDAVKKEALRKAGIGYIEVKKGDRPGDLRRTLERLEPAGRPEQPAG